MKPARKTPTTRRQPKQRRSRLTVDAVLDAVERVLKRDGLAAVTTNRIALVAGVSIGSLYQYFPNKAAIFTALHDRHADQVAMAIEAALVAHTASRRDDRIRALIEAMVDAHTNDPKLYALLSTRVPAGTSNAPGAHERLEGSLRRALGASTRDLDRTLFVLTPMVNALAHFAVMRRPAKLSTTAAKDEIVRAVLTYLNA